MAFRYPEQAITIKNIPKFSYASYFDTYVNMIKYNNDSSATMRLVTSLVDTSREVLEDFIYKTRFDIKELDFVTIDRFNGFLFDKIPEHAYTLTGYDVISDCLLVGYSKYTGVDYKLKEVRINNDFVRHSMPCDCFFSAGVASGGQQLFVLQPNIKNRLDLAVQNTAITIRADGGINSFSLFDSSITLVIEGVNITGAKIKETIQIDSYRDYKSIHQYKNISTLQAIGTTTAFKLILFPYINGEWEDGDNVFDKENNIAYRSLLNVDTFSNKLVYNIIKDRVPQIPVPYEPFRNISLNIPSDEVILSYFIDSYNKLLYTVTTGHMLYCFPLIIPVKYNNTIDSLKTDYQSIKVEYYEDTVTEEITFSVFPSYKSNDIEEMSIFVNGEEVESGILLDLIKTNISTNRFILPFSLLFDGRDDAIVEFRTYGLDYCNLPIYVCNPKLNELYKKDLKNIPLFTDQVNLAYSVPTITSRSVEYKQYVSGDFSNSEYLLQKLSTKGNVLLNGYEIVNVFDTFTYNADLGIIITSDTITNVKSDNVSYIVDEDGLIIDDGESNDITVA